MLKDVASIRFFEGLLMVIRLMVVLLTVFIMFPTMVAYAFIPIDCSLPAFLDSIQISYEFFGTLALKSCLSMGALLRDLIQSSFALLVKFQLHFFNLNMAYTLAHFIGLYLVYQHSNAVIDICVSFCTDLALAVNILYDDFKSATKTIYHELCKDGGFLGNLVGLGVLLILVPWAGAALLRGGASTLSSHAQHLSGTSPAEMLNQTLKAAQEASEKLFA